MVAFQNQCVSNGLKMTMYLMSVIKTLSTKRHLLLINQNQFLTIIHQTWLMSDLFQKSGL